MLTPLHARIMNGMTTEMTRFDANKVRYSNIAPRFQCEVPRNTPKHWDCSHFPFADTGTRTHAPTRTRITPEAIQSFGVFFHPVQTPSHSPNPLALPEGVTPRRRQASQPCAYPHLMMGPLWLRAGMPAPCLKGDRTAAALRAASTVFIGYRTELAVLAAHR